MTIPSWATPSLGCSGFFVEPTHIPAPLRPHGTLCLYCVRCLVCNPSPDNDVCWDCYLTQIVDLMSYSVPQSSDRWNWVWTILVSLGLLIATTFVLGKL